MKKWLGLAAAIAAAVGAHVLPLPAGLEPLIEVIAVLIAGRNTAMTPKPVPDPARVW